MPKQSDKLAVRNRTMSGQRRIRSSFSRSANGGFWRTPTFNRRLAVTVSGAAAVTDQIGPQMATFPRFWEIPTNWGAPGVAGSDADIVSICRLFAEAFEPALQWEEMVRFTSLHEVFEEVQGLLNGVVGHMIDETAKVPSWLTETISKPNVSGTHSLDLVLRLPDGWNEMIDEALERVADGYHD